MVVWCEAVAEPLCQPSELIQKCKRKRFCEFYRCVSIFHLPNSKEVVIYKSYKAGVTNAAGSVPTELQTT